MTVHSLAFKRHPERSEIAFFKDVGPHSKTFCFFDRRTMNWSTITEQNLVSYFVALPDTFEECGKPGEFGTKMRAVFAREPVCKITRTEVNFVNPVPVCA